jgi:hypothetical protein
LEVEELRLGMPGGSRGELQGTVSGPADAPVFDGNLGLRGVSVVRFLGWARGTQLAPEIKGDGSFGLRSQIAIAPGRMTLRDIVADLSGTALYGSVQYRWEGRPELSLTVEGPQIDVRPLVPEGTSLQDLFALAYASSQETAKPGWRGAQMDALVRVNAGQLIAAGRTYRDVALEADLKGGRLRVPSLKLSGDEGYSLELDGEVDDVAGKPKGAIRAVAAAESPQGIPPLAELLGIPNGLRPGERRLQGLAPMRLAGSIAFGSRTATSADLQLDGEAGAASVKGTARFDGGPSGWRNGPADITGSLEGPDAGRIVTALLGSSSPSGGDNARSGRILLKAGGVPSDGLVTLASVDSGDLALGFRGQVSLNNPSVKIAGDVEIKGADAARLATIAGLSPPLKVDALPVTGVLNLGVGDGRFDIDRLALAIGGSEIKGKLSLAPAGERQRITAALSVEELSIAKLLAPVLDQRLAIAGSAEAALSGRQSFWPDEPFDTSVLDGFEGTIKLDTRRLTLAPGLSLDHATFNIALAPGKIDVKEVTGEGLGGRVAAGFTLDKRPAGVELTGSATFDATLEALAPAKAGSAPRATGPLKGTLEYSGRGASPRALISGLQGKATIEVGDARLAALWPGVIGTAIQAAMRVEADRVGPTFRQRLIETLTEGQLPLGPATLAADIVDGQLRSKPIVIDTDQGRASGSVNLDLRSLAFDSEWRLERKRISDKIDEKAALPAVVFTYRGQATALSALEGRINTDAIERELTARKMEVDLEELERLHQLDETRRRSEAERLQREQQDQRPGARPALPSTPVLPNKTNALPATPG